MAQVKIQQTIIIDWTNSLNSMNELLFTERSKAWKKLFVYQMRFHWWTYAEQRNSTKFSKLYFN